MKGSGILISHGQSASPGSSAGRAFVDNPQRKGGKGNASKLLAEAKVDVDKETREINVWEVAAASCPYLIT
ncbi:hypothetical protein QG37_01111 [Candidozyma auris]|nr:hypothetical protein QG37_01111 [[Candida] auris]